MDGGWSVIKQLEEGVLLAIVIYCNWNCNKRLLWPLKIHFSVAEFCYGENKMVGVDMACWQCWQAPSELCIYEQGWKNELSNEKSFSSSQELATTISIRSCGC